MTDQINTRIAKHEASKATLNQNNPKESSLYQYHVDMIKSLKYELTKAQAKGGELISKIKLHVAEQPECDSCGG